MTTRSPLVESRPSLILHQHSRSISGLVVQYMYVILFRCQFKWFSGLGPTRLFLHHGYRDAVDPRPVMAKPPRTGGPGDDFETNISISIWH